MKKLFSLSAVIVLLISLHSCAPRIITELNKQYPPLPEGTPIAVYELENGKRPPSEAELIGKVRIAESGLSRSLSYSEAVQIAREETRKSGANILCVINHQRPSIFGSSMHQIGGLMLLSDSVVRNEGEGYPDSPLYDSGQRGKISSRIKAPVHDLSFHFGPSTITNRTKGLSYSEQQLEKKLSNGLSFVLQYKCHPKGNLYGFGLIASRYEADITKKIEYQGIGFANRLDYIAPLFSMSTALSERWLLGISFGLGYLGFKQTLTDISDPKREGYFSGSTVGANTALNIGYKLNKHLGIGGEIMMVGGVFHPDNIKTTNISAPKPKEKMGANRFDFTIGLHVYL